MCKKARGGGREESNGIWGIGRMGERERCSWEKDEEKGKSGNVSDIEKERVLVKERFRRRMETERRERRGENGRE